MGGQYVNAGTEIPCVVLPTAYGPVAWIAAVVDAGYLKMCLINVTVSGRIAYAYTSGARMTHAQDPTWTTESLRSNGAIVNDFYFKKMLCLYGGCSLDYVRNLFLRLTDTGLEFLHWTTQSSVLLPHNQPRVRT